jgi:hypothetical protein
MRLTLITLFFILAGCATTETVWVKSGATNQDFYIDSSQCKAQGGAIAGVSMYQLVFVYQNCMAGKGWYLEERQKQR